MRIEVESARSGSLGLARALDFIPNETDNHWRVLNCRREQKDMILCFKRIISL